MDKAKKKKLEKAGWKVGTVEEFLGKPIPKSIRKYSSELLIVLLNYNNSESVKKEIARRLRLYDKYCVERIEERNKQIEKSFKKIKN